MLPCGYFCSGKFQFSRTEHLSSHPLLSSLPSESLFASLYSFAPSASYRFFFKSLLTSQGREPLVTHFFFLRRSFPSISLAASVTSVFYTDIHVFIFQSIEWCEFPTYRCLNSASHIWVTQPKGQTLVLAGLAFAASSDEHERSSSPGHGHFLCLLQENSLSYGC